MAENLLQKLVDEAVLLQLGERVLAIIHARTLRGEFLPGSTNRGYSTKDAPMPFGGLMERIGKGRAAQLLRAIKEGSDDRVHTSKTGKMWITLAGGYKRIRELTGRETDRVTLNWSGAMLSAMKTKFSLAELSAVIYFSDKESEQIAGFHHQGAGRSRIKRIFLGLTNKEQTKIERWLGEEIAKRIRIDFPTSSIQNKQ